MQLSYHTFQCKAKQSYADLAMIVHKRHTLHSAFKIAAIVMYILLHKLHLIGQELYCNKKKTPPQNVLTHKSN